jgi:hypothetical protein
MVGTHRLGFRFDRGGGEISRFAVNVEIVK